jgi:paraquat-inducible protein A
MEGVIAMWKMDSYFVSIVILLASIFIPAFKIVSIAVILYTTKYNKIRFKRRVSKLYRFVLFIGRWSLIDVYVVIIMAAIVRIKGFIVIYPGFAIICFCAVVIITVFSADEFDERLIWDSDEN